jgi:hypothetical protein
VKIGKWKLAIYIEIDKFVHIYIHNNGTEFKTSVPDLLLAIE